MGTKLLQAVLQLVRSVDTNEKVGFICLNASKNTSGIWAGL